LNFSALELADNRVQYKSWGIRFKFNFQAMYCTFARAKISEHDMSDIPHYFLYGEAASSNALTYLHIASLEESLPKHNWESVKHSQIYSVLH